jgi:hypothetical protein
MTDEQLLTELQIIQDPMVERKESWAISRVFVLYHQYYGKRYPNEGGCINCAMSAFFQMKHDLREKGLFLKSNKVPMKKYEMVVSSFMMMEDPTLYQRATMTDELAEKLMKAFPKAKQYFRKVEKPKKIKDGQNN